MPSTATRREGIACTLHRVVRVLIVFGAWSASAQEPAGGGRPHDEEAAPIGSFDPSSASPLRATAEGGRVRLSLDVDAEGRVRHVEVLGRAPAAVVAEAVRHASALRFARGDLEGDAIRRRHLLVLDVPAALRSRVSPSRASGDVPHTTHPSQNPQASRTSTPDGRRGADESLAPDPRPRPDSVERAVVASSEDDVEIASVRDVPRFHASDFLTLLPGLVLDRPGGEGAAPTMSFRGFDAGAGRNLEVLVEGMPLNEPANVHSHGHADLQFLIPELVRSLRARPGTFDPDQGDFALAGTVDLRLGADRGGLRATGGVGSYRRRRALLMWSSGREGAAEDDFVAVEVQTGAGFGAHRAHWNVRSLARVVGGGEKLGWSLLIGSHALAYESAGLLREDAEASSCGDHYDAFYFCSHDPSQGASASRHFAVAGAHRRWEGHRLDVRAWGQLRRHRVRENPTYRLFDPRGDGLDQRTDGSGFGLRADYLVERAWRGATQGFELGLLTRHDRGEARVLQLGWGTSDPYAILFDRAFGLTHVSGYAAGVLRLARISLRGGVRIAGFSLSSQDLAPPEGEIGRATDALGVAVLPRANLRVALWDASASSLSWTTSFGLGARPVEAWAMGEGERASLTHARALESGLRIFLRSWDPPGHVPRTFRGFAFEGRLGTFWTRVDHDLLYDLRQDHNVLIPATNRFGGFLQTRMTFEGWVELRGSLAWNEAHRVSEGGRVLALASGPRLPFVPRFAGRYDVVFRREVSVRRERALVGVAVGGSVIGRRPMPLDSWSERLSVLDASVRLGWRFLELELLAHNLFGARYRQLELEYTSRLDGEDPLASLRPERHFAVGPPRQVMAVLTIAFDWAARPADGADETSSRAVAAM